MEPFANVIELKGMHPKGFFTLFCNGIVDNVSHKVGFIYNVFLGRIYESVKKLIDYTLFNKKLIFKLLFAKTF